MSEQKPILCKSFCNHFIIEKFASLQQQKRLHPTIVRELEHNIIKLINQGYNYFIVDLNSPVELVAADIILILKECYPTFNLQLEY